MQKSSPDQSPILDIVDDKHTPLQKGVEENMSKKSATDNDGTQPSRERMLDTMAQHFKHKPGSEPSESLVFMAHKMALLTTDEALAVLRKAVEVHADDPNFPSETMTKLTTLLRGRETWDVEDGDYDLELKAEAAIIHYHSPYPEVRSVTVPTEDDMSEPCETWRAYFLGVAFVTASTASNTFFSPRQPGIQITAQVLQLLLAPCGMFLARVLPVWGGRDKWYSLNPGPWSYKEQMLATIIFTASEGRGRGFMFVYIVQRMPRYLNRTWVSFGYEITLALATQTLGMGVAGLLRRFVIYPVTALWPSILPALALNRALVADQKKNDEAVHGWRLSRNRFFMLAAAIMFLWFWVPNTLFTGLRLFNWMTWIAPNNFTLGMITGSYGGMGFNPWSTFDWNVAGTGALVTPFFSYIQQYAARVISGLIIIAMYWSNAYWSAYMPINSNEAFANDGKKYNVTRVLNEQGTFIDFEKYDSYGPPFFSGANVFGQGAWFAWYPTTLFTVVIRNWDVLKQGVVDMYRGLRFRASPEYKYVNTYRDPQSRAAHRYSEVPDWWYLAMFIGSLGLTLAGLLAFPLGVPVWPVLVFIVMSIVVLIPTTTLLATANVEVSFSLFFEVLAGVWMAGNPEALLILNAVGGRINDQAEVYLAGQKMGHYSRIPPRAVFRGQILAVILNAFIVVGMLELIIATFNRDGTLCQWNNPSHFVCSSAVTYYASAVIYGAFGVRNMFALYPVMPWCFLIGSIIGLSWGLGRRYGPRIRKYLAGAQGGEMWEKYLSRPLSYLHWFDPAIFWAGALTWTAGNNLTYATNRLYISFIFMYYIKRRYSAWWEKYNYLIEAGLDVGVALSAIVQTLAFDFTGASLDWWGNSVSTQGVDFKSYLQNATLLPIPEKGYFGPEPKDWPHLWN